VQVHCGFGDADLFLPRADPTLLGPLIERYATTPFVLLHCYPFVRQAGWLAHVYGNVFLDVSLTIPHVWRAAEMVREALELAPASKLLYASDASRTPELYFLAARGWRAALAEVLGEALDPAAAEAAARRVLRENAMGLYGLG
jgi:predicted TIM-barrel fold metal-dependent hydrolase